MIDCVWLWHIVFKKKKDLSFAGTVGEWSTMVRWAPPQDPETDDVTCCNVIVSACVSSVIISYPFITCATAVLILMNGLNADWLAAQIFVYYSNEENKSSALLNSTDTTFADIQVPKNESLATWLSDCNGSSCSSLVILSMWSTAPFLLLLLLSVATFVRAKCISESEELCFRWNCCSWSLICIILIVFLYVFLRIISVTKDPTFGDCQLLSWITIIWTFLSPFLTCCFIGFICFKDDSQDKDKAQATSQVQVEDKDVEASVKVHDKPVAEISEVPKVHDVPVAEISEEPQVYDIQYQRQTQHCFVCFIKL